MKHDAVFFVVVIFTSSFALYFIFWLKSNFGPQIKF